MCVPNSEMPPAPIIPVDVCMLCKKRKAQPEIGICRRCERNAYSVSDIFAVALIMAVLGLFTGCAPRVIYRDAPATSYSIVTYRVPRRNSWTGKAQFNRAQERVTFAEAEDFLKSFTDDERRVLDVHRTDFVITQKENSK